MTFLSSIFPGATLAFGFASPWLLWGAALGAAPILLHLLHRRRHREMAWAAMRFLAAAVQKHQRRLRIEQLLLLAVRVMILVLLALALAQPYAESLGRYFQADVPTHRVIVVDVSFSLGVQDGDATRFERARSIARDIVSRSRQGDAVNLLRISQRPPRAVISEPSFQRQQVLSEIDQLTVTDEPAELAPTLHEVLESLGRAADLPRKEVYFLSDFQATSWNEESAAGQKGIRDLLQRIGDAAEITLIDVGEPATPNLAVVDLALEEAFLTTDRPANLLATIRNFGASVASEQTVELLIDGRLAESRRVELPAGSPVRATFPLAFSSPGEHTVEVRLPPDRLPIDDRRLLTVDVRDELRVLLVDGHPRGKSLEAATWFLEKALSPSTSRQHWSGLMRPTVISEGELAATDLSAFDAVFLCDLRLITDREVDVLKSFVVAGGGLVICAGPQLQPENYNQMLGRDGAALLPARIAGRAGDARTAEETFEFDTSHLTHPIVLPFRGNPNVGLEASLTLEYLKYELPADGQSRIVLPFANGDPAIVERSMGQGRVVLWATSANTDWSNGAIQNSFPPLVHETVQFVVSGAMPQRQLLVGATSTRRLPAWLRSGAAALKGPDGKSRAVAFSEEGDREGILLDSLDRSGMYELTLAGRPPRTELYAVNVDARESDLASLGPNDLRADLFSGIDFHEGLHQLEPGTAILGPGAPSRGGLTRWLLLGAFLLMFVEQVMAWRFTAGLAALTLAIAVFAIRALVPSEAFLTALGWTLLALVPPIVVWRRRRLPGV